MLFDAVAVVPGPSGADALLRDPAAIGFVMYAFAHLKVIGHTPPAIRLLQAAGVRDGDAGVVLLGPGGAERFVDIAKQGRIWTRAA